MLKIGQIVKFNKYHPKNLVTGRPFERAIPGYRKVPYNLKHIHFDDDNNMIISMRILESDVTEAQYIGKCRKKFARIYKAQEEEALEETPLGMTIRRPTRRRAEWKLDRYSTNPSRMDDPRDLDEFAIVKWGRRMVLVPMENLMKCTYNREVKVI